MAYNIKYQYTFNSLQGDDCLVYLFVKDYSGDVKVLDPGLRPFVLREFNTDNDFFKPIRPFQAELEILASNVSLEDFLFNEDDSVQIQFYFNGTLFWLGWLMNDDIQENWIDTNHYITLRATDGLGQIAADPFTLIDGQQDMFSYLYDATLKTAFHSLYGQVIINNLFYDGMLDKTDGEYHPLNQATIDGKTFEGDDNQKVVEKINRAWSQTIYQYFGKMWIVRQEEFLNNTAIDAIETDIGSNVAVTKDYDVNIGREEGIVPIMPEMLRGIRRPFKETKIKYFYKFPNEIICNQDFRQGTLTSDEYATTLDPPIDDELYYTIDCWTLRKGVTGSTTAPDSGVKALRIEELDVDDEILDDYIIIETSSGQNHILESSPVYINKDDSIEFAFDFRVWYSTDTGVRNILAANVTVEAAGGIVYYLDSDGFWVTSTGFGGLRSYINIPYASGEPLKDWKNISIKSKGVPQGGVLKVWLFSSSSLYPSPTAFKDIQFSIKEASKQPGVIGDYDKYTIADTVRQNYDEETFLDDSNNKSHKGAIFFGTDLTGDSWYRMFNPTERLTFKRQKAIAHMNLNKRFRNKLEVNMYGIKYNDGGTYKPVWLMNKFVFTEDAPTKKWMISNLSEMDFYNATWKASLIEVWDSTDSADPDDYPPHSFANIYQKDV